jgi:hypothetical protein
MRRRAGIWLLVIGLIVGPGSLIASRFFSGHVVAGAPLAFQAGADGSVRARFAFSLADKDLPAAVIVQASARHGPALLPADPPADRWTLRLVKDGSTLRERTMQLQSTLVESSPTLTFKEAVPLDAEDGGGDYVLEIEPQGSPRLALDAARAEVRAGVESADRTWLVAGLALIAAGLALILSA